LVSVIGLQLISGEFEEFLKQRGIVHCQTSVYNLEANGRVEQVNRNISKLLKVQSDLQNFKTLQEVMNDYFNNYNNTQHDTNGKKSTSFLLRFNPRTRLDILPASTGEHSFTFLKPSEQFKDDDTDEVETRTRTKQNSLQNYANQRRRPTKTNKFHVSD
jgi:transposase InsO family protein